MTSSCGLRAPGLMRLGAGPHPIAVTFAARLEKIEALPGTKLGSPRIMPDETKLAPTDCASHGIVKPVTFQAVWHCFLLLACAHFGCAKTKRLIINGSIVRRLSTGIQGGRAMIPRLRALGRVPEFARCDLATAEALSTSHAGLASQSSSR